MKGQDFPYHFNSDNERKKKGILTDTLFQFSFFKPYVVAINLLPQPPYYYTKNQYLYI